MIIDLVMTFISILLSSAVEIVLIPGDQIWAPKITNSMRKKQQNKQDWKIRPKLR